MCQILSWSPSSIEKMVVDTIFAWTSQQSEESKSFSETLLNSLSTSLKESLFDILPVLWEKIFQPIQTSYSLLEKSSGENSMQLDLHPDLKLSLMVLNILANKFSFKVSSVTFVR